MVPYYSIHWMEAHSWKEDMVQNSVYARNMMDKGRHHLFHDRNHHDMRTMENTESKMVIHDKVDDHKNLFFLRFHFFHLQLVKVNVASCIDTMSRSDNSRKKVFEAISTGNEKVKVLVNYND